MAILDSDTAMTCPVCGFDYVHPQDIKTVPGNDNYEAWTGRGDLIVITMNCEEGHQWELCLGTHKGQTWQFTRPVTKKGKKDADV